MLAALFLCAAAASAHAADTHDWYVVKIDGQAYAYDAADVETGAISDVKTVTLYIGGTKDDQEVIYDIHCLTNRGSFVGSLSDTQMIMTEGNGDPSEPGWESVVNDPTMEIAADVACRRPLRGAVHADSQQAALDMLKNLSN